MSHKAALEALDKTLRDPQGNNLMGDITLLKAGDFRQTLPGEIRLIRSQFASRPPTNSSN